MKEIWFKKCGNLPLTNYALVFSFYGMRTQYCKVPFDDRNAARVLDLICYVTRDRSESSI